MFNPFSAGLGCVICKTFFPLKKSLFALTNKNYSALHIVVIIFRQRVLVATRCLYFSPLVNNKKQTNKNNVCNTILCNSNKKAYGPNARASFYIHERPQTKITASQTVKKPSYKSQVRKTQVRQASTN